MAVELEAVTCGTITGNTSLTLTSISNNNIALNPNRTGR